MNKNEIDLLDKILSKTNDWLKFAEAKNGAIVAIVCAVMFGVFRLVLNLNEINVYLQYYLISFFSFSALSLVISLYSFIPRLKKPFWLNAEEKSSFDNPFYFADACKYDSYSYLELLGITRSGDYKLAENIADQIVVNSKVATLKFGLFATSAWFFLSALLTPILAIAIWLSRE